MFKVFGRATRSAAGPHGRLRWRVRGTLAFTSLALTLGLALSASSTATAVTIWNISGTFSANVSLVGEFDVGDPFDFSITFDENQIGTSSGSFTVYLGVATFSSGAYAASDPTAEIFIADAPTSVSIVIGGPDASIPDITQLDSNQMPVGTRSPNAIRSVFQFSDLIPTEDLTTFLDLGSFAFDTQQLVVVTPGGASPLGEISQVVTVVPEPGSALLLGLGLAGLAGLSGSRRDQY